MNVGVDLARLGHKVAYFGAIGGDESGRVQAALASFGLDVAGLRVVPKGRTAFTEIATRPDGERRWPRRVRCLPRLSADRSGCGAAQTQASCPHRLVGQRRRAQTRSHPGGRQRFTGPDRQHRPEPCLGRRLAGRLRLGRPEERAEALLRNALSAGARVAVITCGPLGSRASDGKERAAAPAAPASILDTTGAGDSLIAAFLDAYLAGGNLTAALQAGATLAAAACSHIGGFPQSGDPII